MDIVSVHHIFRGEERDDTALVLYVSRLPSKRIKSVQVQILKGPYDGEVIDFPYPLKLGWKITRISGTVKEGAEKIAKGIRGDVDIPKVIVMDEVYGFPKPTKYVTKSHELTLASRVAIIEEEYMGHKTINFI